LTSMKKELGDCTRRLRLCWRASSSRGGWRRSTSWARTCGHRRGSQRVRWEGGRGSSRGGRRVVIAPSARVTRSLGSSTAKGTSDRARARTKGGRVGRRRAAPPPSRKTTGTDLRDARRVAFNGARHPATAPLVADRRGATERRREKGVASQRRLKRANGRFFRSHGGPEQLLTGAGRRQGGRRRRRAGERGGAPRPFSLHGARVGVRRWSERRKSVSKRRRTGGKGGEKHPRARKGPGRRPAAGAALPARAGGEGLTMVLPSTGKGNSR